MRYGKAIQNIFTTAKTGALFALIAIGILIGWNADVVQMNFGDLWRPREFEPIADGVSVLTTYGVFVALCVSQTGSLFSADAWNNITFTAGEVKDPRRNIPLSLAFGTIIVISLYLLANVAYLVTLPLDAIQHAPSDRVATATLAAVAPSLGASLLALLDHGVDLRLQQRTDSGRRACLLRHGARQAVLRPSGGNSTTPRCPPGA